MPTPSTPNTLYFLPETHIVVLPGGRVVGAYEDAWARLRAHLSEADAALPRAVTLITGPSRTGEIAESAGEGADVAVLLDRTRIIRFSSTIATNTAVQHAGPKLGIIVTGGEETRDPA